MYLFSITTLNSNSQHSYHSWQHSTTSEETQSLHNDKTPNSQQSISNTPLSAKKHPINKKAATRKGYEADNEDN